MISRYMRQKSLLRIQTPGAALAAATPAFEPLEQRLLLSGDVLMDLSEYMVYPQIHYGYTGQLAYDAATESFDSDAVPFLWVGPDGMSWSSIEPSGILGEIAVSPDGQWDQDKYYIPLDDSHYMCRKISQTQFQALGTTASGQIESPPAYYVPDSNPNVYYYIFEGDPGFLPDSDRDFNDFMVKVELHDGTATLTPWDLPGSSYQMFLVDPGTREDLLDPSNPAPVPQWEETALSTTVIGTNSRSFELNLQVDDSGNLVGGGIGDDLRIFGQTYTPEHGTLTGVLLTGEILDFGYADHGTFYEEFGFLFEPTGGELLPYFGDLNGGLYMIGYGSNFTGHFTSDFTGNSYGYLGPIVRPDISMDKFVRVETVSGDGTIIQKDHGPRRPVSLTFDYTGGGEDATETAQRWNQYSVGGDPDDAPVVNIIASSKANFRDALPENTYFSGQLNLGEEFVVAVDNATTAYSSTSTSRNTPDLFKPDTYVYIIDDLTGEILQSIKYHTSGSEPIVIGDVLGGVTLTGISFPDRKGANPGEDPPDDSFGDDADEGPGIDVVLGDTITWTYVVSNPGDVPLNNVTVTDDNTTPLDPGDDFNAPPITENGFNIGDANMDGWLDMDETWLFRFSQVADVEGQFTNVGNAAGYYPDRNKWVDFDDPANYLVTLPPIDVGATGERPQVLVMRYTGDGPEASSYAQGAAHVSVTGDPNDNPTVHIIATDRPDFSYSNIDVYFDGEVALGELFAIDATDAGVSRLAPNLFIFIYDPATNDLLQSVKFHTSCSEAIVLGDQFGAVKLNGYLGWRGTRLGLVPVELLTSLSGFVFEDFNSDGMVDFNEHAIENAQVTLTGTNDRGEAVERTDTTGQDGAYFFENLRPGNYTITQTQPAGYEDGVDSVGTAGGVTGIDLFADINLRAHVDGANYNFGERPLAGSTIQTGQTATIGFWAGRKGQQLLKSLNGDQSSKQLGDWLAATFPNMYQNLGGKGNANVARTFTHLFKKAGMNDKRNEVLELEAQVMATALAAYVTNSNLAGYVAEDYGFVVTDYGLSIATWNVGTSGAAFGVADGTEMTVMDLLLAANQRAEDGNLYSLNQEPDTLLRSLANEVFKAINELGL